MPTKRLKKLCLIKNFQCFFVIASYVKIALLGSNSIQIYVTTGGNLKK